MGLGRHRLEASRPGPAGAGAGLWPGGAGGPAGVAHGSSRVPIEGPTRTGLEPSLNDIVPSGPLVVRAERGRYILHRSDNYWGVETAAEISALILDGNDDSTVNAVVAFEPFSQATVPAPAASFGALKALYGGGGQE